MIYKYVTHDNKSKNYFHGEEPIKFIGSFNENHFKGFISGWLLDFMIWIYECIKNFSNYQMNFLIY